MFQVRFHGRGGQGVVPAAELLTSAAFREGRQAQALVPRTGGIVDSAVGINSVERFLGNEALRPSLKVPVDAAPTGKRVLVAGAGPPAYPPPATSPAQVTR